MPEFNDRTITDVFLNPNPDEVDAVTRERAAALAELEHFILGEAFYKIVDEQGEING